MRNVPYLSVKSSEKGRGAGVAARRGGLWYNWGMNQDQTMFAEMLGIRKTPPPSAEQPQVVRSVDRGASVAGEFIDELDIQKEVVEEMAREKAELEERYGLLETERQKLETEKQTLEAEKQTLENEKKALEEARAALEESKRAVEAEKEALEARLSALEGDFAELKRELERARIDNGELEEKLARMGRSLAAARRARYTSTADKS